MSEMDHINITDVKIYLFEVENIRAYADITIDDSLTIKGLKILQAPSGGLYIGYPSRRGKEGKYQELVVPVNSRVAEAIRRVIIDRYKELVSKAP